MVETLTPEGHEDGEEHGCVVVKDPAGAGVGAGSTQLPVGTLEVTQRTHGEVLTLVTNLITAEERQWKQLSKMGRKYLNFCGHEILLIKVLSEKRTCKNLFLFSLIEQCP